MDEGELPAASRSVGIGEEAGSRGIVVEKQVAEEKKYDNRKALKRVGDYVLGDVLGEGAKLRGMHCALL
jgi:hypothetical protein